MYSNSVLSKLTPLFAVVTLPAGVLAAIFLGGSAAIAVFVVGWLLLTPVSAVLFDSSAPTPGPVQGEDRVKQQVDTGERSSEDPVEKLRERYARGEIDEAELERRLDALLETEDLNRDDERGIERATNSIDTGDSEGVVTGRDTETGDPGTDKVELERE